MVDDYHTHVPTAYDAFPAIYRHPFYEGKYVAVVPPNDTGGSRYDIERELSYSGRDTEEGDLTYRELFNRADELRVLEYGRYGRPLPENYVFRGFRSHFQSSDPCRAFRVISGSALDKSCRRYDDAVDQQRESETPFRTMFDEAINKAFPREGREDPEDQLYFFVRGWVVTTDPNQPRKKPKNIHIPGMRIGTLDLEESLRRSGYGHQNAYYPILGFDKSELGERMCAAYEAILPYARESHAEDLAKMKIGGKNRLYDELFGHYYCLVMTKEFENATEIDSESHEEISELDYRLLQKSFMSLEFFHGFPPPLPQEYEHLRPYIDPYMDKHFPYGPREPRLLPVLVSENS
jgi:hypothetical protein